MSDLSVLLLLFDRQLEPWLSVVGGEQTRRKEDERERGEWILSLPTTFAERPTRTDGSLRVFASTLW